MPGFDVTRIIDLAGILLGTAIGGLVTWLVTRSTEARSWRRQRREKLAEIEREALSAALEWAEPMRNAYIRAGSLISGALRGDIDDSSLLSEWPNLLGTMTQMDLAANMRAVLPSDVYKRGISIIHEFEELQSQGIRYGQEVKVSGQPFRGLRECSNRLDSIRVQIDSLEEDLRTAYRATFTS